MKKLLFVLAFAFIGQQAFSQMYMVVMSENSCTLGEIRITTINNLGVSTTDTCINSWDPVGYTGDSPNYNALNFLTLEINNIIALGYKLTHIDSEGIIKKQSGAGTATSTNAVNSVYFLSIP